jgi:hypothetical protein
MLQDFDIRSNLDWNILLTDQSKNNEERVYKTNDETTSDISHFNRLKSSVNESEAWNRLVNNSKNDTD